VRSGARPPGAAAKGGFGARPPAATEALPGYREVKPMVFCGLFPIDSDRYPDLRVGLAELGFAWLPSLLWRFDKDWKALWRETPWVRDKPSVYVRKHLRATTSPTLIPGSVPAREVAQLAIAEPR